MPLQKVGINWTNIQNITPPDFDLANSTEEFIADVPQKANEITKGWLGFIVLSGLFFFLLWLLSRENFYGGDFGLSNLRSVGVAAGICSVLGLIMLNLGYFTNYYHVVIFMVTTFGMAFAVWKAEK